MGRFDRRSAAGPKRGAPTPSPARTGSLLRPVPTGLKPPIGTKGLTALGYDPPKAEGR
jgi:hypothetical protein